MAIINQPTFQTDLPKEQRLPLLGEPLITQGTLDRLNLPESLKTTLTPDSVLQYLRSQSVQLNEITNRPVIMSLQSEIPEYTDGGGMGSLQSDLSEDERQAFNDLSRRVTVGIQSGELTSQTLSDEIGSFLDDSKSKNPELWKDFNVGDMITDDMFMREIQESEEERKDWEQKLRVAASSGNPELYNAVMGERYASRMMKMMGRLLQKQQSYIDQRDKVMADLGLEKDASAAGLAKANMEFGKFTGEINSVMMEFQYAMNEYQRITEDTASTNAEIARPLQVMIQNLRSG